MPFLISSFSPFFCLIVPLLWVCLCTLEKQWKGQFEATLKDDSGTNHASLDGQKEKKERDFFVALVSGK